MAKITLVFALLLVALGLVGFIGTGSEHLTALIPTWIGVLLGLFGLLALSPDVKRRKLFMHINVTIATLGFLGTLSELFRSSLHAKATGIPITPAALASKLSLAALLLVYVILCVRSFVEARRKGVV